MSEILSIVAPVYICCGVGYLWGWLGRPFDTALFTDLIMRVGAPCLVFSSLVSYEIQFDEAAEMIPMRPPKILPHTTSQPR